MTRKALSVHCNDTAEDFLATISSRTSMKAIYKEYYDIETVIVWENWATVFLHMPGNVTFRARK